MTSVTSTHRSRDALLRRIERLAPQILFGTLSDTYRTCGRAGCHCHQGEKHGPHLYVSFRGPEGRTQGYYVPQALATPMRAGVAAWQELQEGLRALAEVNRQRLWAARGPRWPRSRAHGRPGTPAEVVLRMLVLKHLYDWSFDECEREVRGSLVYRAFCRIDCERVPDAKTLIRLAPHTGAAAVQGIVRSL